MSPAPLVSFTKVQNSQKQNVQMNVVFDSEHFQKVIAPLEMLIVFLKICKRIFKSSCCHHLFHSTPERLDGSNGLLVDQGNRVLHLRIIPESLNWRQQTGMRAKSVQISSSRVILFKVNKSFRIKYHCAFSYN